MKSEHKVRLAALKAQMRHIEMMREDYKRENKTCAPNSPNHGTWVFQNLTSQYSLCVSELQILASEIRMEGEQMACRT